MVDPDVERLEKLLAEVSLELSDVTEALALALEQRDDYIARFEREQREHEATKGYRAHAEAQLELAQRACSVCGKVAPCPHGKH